MLFRLREIEDRLSALDARLANIERVLAEMNDSKALRGELEKKREQLDAVGRQGLQVVELLDAARAEIERLKAGGAR